MFSQSLHFSLGLHGDFTNNTCMAAFENFSPETTGLQNSNRRKTSSKKNPIKHYFPELNLSHISKLTFFFQNFFYW